MCYIFIQVDFIKNNLNKVVLSMTGDQDVCWQKERIRGAGKSIQQKRFRHDCCVLTAKSREINADQRIHKRQNCHFLYGDKSRA